jgi:hypothetical protein
MTNEIIVQKYGQFLFAACFHAGFLLGLFFDPEDGSNMFFPKRRLTFNGLRGVIFREKELFTITLREPQIL